jgi:hypothetical protein
MTAPIMLGDRRFLHPAMQCRSFRGSCTGGTFRAAFRYPRQLRDLVGPLLSGERFVLCPVSRIRFSRKANHAK